MSMVYDPVTREFRPRDARSLKPVAERGDLASSKAEPESGGAHRFRRGQSVRRQRRRREVLFWVLMMVITAILVLSTMLIAKRLRPQYSLPERSLIDRNWQFQN